MRIGVIGTGVMGKAISSYLSLFDCVDVIQWVGSADQKALCEMDSLKKVARRIARKIGSSRRDYVDKLIPINNINNLRDIDILIEAVKENIDIKKDIFRKVDNAVSENCIIATNTSSISITGLASVISNPRRVLGLHFFNPIEFTDLVEVISGFYTSDETISSVKDFIGKIEKKAVYINETPGFIVNRMLIPMINEAITLLAEGAAKREAIDDAMKYGANHPIGPLSLADLIGNDVVLSIMQTLFEETNDPKYRPHYLLKKMVRSGSLGRKTKIGFYEY